MTDVAYPVGECKLGIVFLKDMPSADEIEAGSLFSDSIGSFYRRYLRRQYNIEFDIDCLALSIIPYRTKNGKLPKKKELNPYIQTLHEILDEVKPKLIFACGAPAIKIMLPHCPLKEVTDFKMHGRLINETDNSYGVGCLIADPVSDDYRKATARDIDIIFSLLNSDKLVIPGITNDDVIITGHDHYTVQDVVDVLTKYIDDGRPVAYDYETNCKSPYTVGACPLCVSLSNDGITGAFIPFHFHDWWTDIECAFVQAEWIKFLKSDVPKIVQNFNFEEYWNKVYFGISTNNYYDTLVGNHILDERTGVSNLEFQTYQALGCHHKDLVDVKNLVNEDPLDVVEYSLLDAKVTRHLLDVQNEIIDREKWSRKPFDFFFKSNSCFVNCRIRGVAVDKKELMLQKDEAEEVLENTTKKLDVLPMLVEFERINECKINLESNTGDLRKLFFKQLKLKPFAFTDKDNPSVAADALEQYVASDKINDDVKEFITLLLTRRKYLKLISTYLNSYIKFSGDGTLIRPEQSLSTTRSFRSSCFEPNLQFIQKRTEIGKRLRKIFVPKFDLFLDGDFAGAELNVLAMFSKDRNLVNSLRKHEDVHRQWAARLFEKKECDITSEERFKSKNSFVFPLCYGSYYKSIAKDIDMPIKHIRPIEKLFWKKYYQLKKWQDKFYEMYLKRGYTESLFGFRRHGPLKKREVINTPVQGTSFHLLLNGMYHADNEMIKRGMKSGIVLQIHDEVLVDCTNSEIEETLDICDISMSKKYFDWQIVPSRVDWSVGKNLYDLEEI